MKEALIGASFNFAYNYLLQNSANSVSIFGKGDEIRAIVFICNIFCGYDKQPAKRY